MRADAPWGLIDARPIVGRVGTGDLGVAAVAAEQEGLITVPQLRFVGLGDGAVHRRSRAGRLHRLHRGVYAVGHRSVSELGSLAAAFLSVGPGSAVSHVPAAVAAKMLPDWQGPVDITLPVANGHRRSRAGIRVHRTGALDARDLQLHHRIPVTTPARTLIDLVETEPHLLEPALNEARAIRLFTQWQLDRAIERNGSRRGARRLRSLLAAESDPGFSRNRAERILAGLLQSAGLAAPQRNRRRRWSRGSLPPLRSVRGAKEH